MTRRRWLLSTLTAAPLRALPLETAQPASAPALPFDAVALDTRTARTLSEQGSARLASLPGSTLKPLVLAVLLARKLLKPDERLVCPGGFRLAGRNLECIHVHGAGPFDAVEALAASCNYWFATMARRLGPAGLLEALRHSGLAADTASDEDQAGLQALGLAHVSATPWTLAQAYLKLLRSAPPAPVSAGLRAAVERGTAQRALSQRVFIAGKTGTSPGERPGSTVGWFAGWAHRPAAAPAGGQAGARRAASEMPEGIVFAVRVPGGTGGGEAADQARILAEKWA